MSNIELYRSKLSEQEYNRVQEIEFEAESTPARDKGLAIHVGAIEKLRAKGYSYRDIATWFNERGFKVSHVDVWRAHKNSLEAPELFGLADNDEEWQEYMRKKQEGNVTKYEDVIPEKVETAPKTEETPVKPEKTIKEARKRTRKVPGRK